MPYSIAQKKALFRGYNKRRTNASLTIQRAFRARKKQSTMVKRVMYKMEPYKYDAFTASTTLGSAWSIISNITNVSYDPNGTTDSGTRQTTKILCKNLSIRGKITPATGDTTNICRLALVRGRRAGNLNVADIAYGGANDIDAQFNQKFVDVIWDKTFNVQEQAVGAVFPPYKYWDTSTMLNKICKFEEQSGAGTIQPYNNTSYYLIGCSDSSVAPNPAVRLSSRLSYKQLD